LCRCARVMVSQGKKLEMKIIETVEKCLGEILCQSDLETVAVEYRRESSGWVLRVYLDKPGGVRLSDCSRVSGQLRDLLEVRDVIPGAYTLEVTSPGVNRPLKKTADFQKVIGETVKLKTGTFLDGRRNFKGVLKGVKAGVLLIESDGKEFSIPCTAIKKANLAFDFNKKKQF